MPLLKQISTILVLCIGISVNAQEGWMVGFAPTLESSESLLGFNTRAYFGINERFCFGPEISFYPYQEIDTDHELQIAELNLNAHYLFELVHRFGVYPLGGFNYTFENERLLANSDEVDKLDALGLNYGLGAHYSMNRVLLFAEFKGVISQLSDEFFTTGVVILLEKPKSRHDDEINE